MQMVSNRDEGCYTVNELRDDLIIIDTHSGPVTDASFAPDGTALATASKDGTVKFFQVSVSILLLLFTVQSISQSKSKTSRV